MNRSGSSRPAMVPAKQRVGQMDVTHGREYDNH